MTVTAAQRTTQSTARTGGAPFALVALVLLPLFFGALRLVELAGGPALMPGNPRLDASPVPVVTHIVSAVGYTVLDAFQFSAGLRRRRPGWHRVTGRVLVVLGLAVTLSALWMTRAYALALGAATQLFTLAIGPAVFGPGVLTLDVSLGAARVIHLAVAEYVIPRRSVPRATVRVGSP